MSQIEPQSGDAPSSNDAAQPLEGNRPANNSLRSTPGSLSTRGYQGGEGADDFLGLDAEVGSSTRASSAFDLMSEPAEPVAQPVDRGAKSLSMLADDSSDLHEPEPEAPAAFEDEPEFTDYAQSVEPADDEYDSPPERAEQEQEPEPEPEPRVDWEDDAGSDDLHGSWQEEQPRNGGTGRLVGMAMGMLVLGGLGMAGFKFMSAANQSAPEVSEPLAAINNTRAPSGSELAAPLDDVGAVDSGSVGFESAGAEQMTDPGAEFAQSSSATAEEAREEFDALRDNEPPVWFDPSLDSKGEAAETGWSPEAEAVTQVDPGSSAVEQPVATLILADTEAIAASTSTASEQALAQTETPVETATEVLELVGSDLSDPSSSATAVAQAEAQGSQEYDAASLISLTPPSSSATSASAPASASAAGASVKPGTTLVAAQPSSEASVPQSSAQLADGGVGPPRPAGGVTSLLPGNGAVATHNQSRQSRTTTLKVEDVLIAPAMDSSNLRQASAQDLSGVWNESTIPPVEAIGSKHKVLTPAVGRVRVILKSKDIFEGRLYAVGQGNVWIENENGRLAVTGTRIASVAQLDSKEGTPELGSTGSQDLNGMARVRIKTPGGTFYGKVITRDDTRTTLITDDGARLTLDNKEVEFLTDVPRVTIRKLPEGEGKP